MALKWFDGAEVWGTATHQTLAYASAAASVATPGRLAPGARYISMSGASQHLTTPSLGLQNTWTIGFGLRQGAAGTFELRALKSDGEQVRLETVQDGTEFQLRLVRGETTIFTSSSSFAADTWHYFELQITVRDGTDGAYELRHNEITIDSGSGVDLADEGSDGADSFSIGYGTLRLDDFYILDSTGANNNDFLGDSVMVALVPTADGATNEWTPSTGGDNYALVDEGHTTAPSGADYVSTDTNGDQELYEYENLPTSGLGTVYGVKLSHVSRLAATGSRVVKAQYRSAAGTVADGEDFSVIGAVAADRPIIMDINPVSTDPWTQNDIDDGQFGFEVVS